MCSHGLNTDETRIFDSRFSVQSVFHPWLLFSSWRAPGVFSDFCILPSAFQQNGFAFGGEGPQDAPEVGPLAEDPAADFALAEGGLELGNPQRRGDRLFEAGEEDRFAARLVVHVVQGAEDGFDNLVAAVNSHSIADSGLWSGECGMRMARETHEQTLKGEGREFNRSKQREQRPKTPRLRCLCFLLFKVFGRISVVRVVRGQNFPWLCG